MKTRSKKHFISVIIVTILISSLILPINSIEPMPAMAATTPPASTIEVSYTTSTGYKMGSDMFDATPTLTTNSFTINAPSGYVIDNVTIKQFDNTTDIVSPDLMSSSNWKGQANWTGKAIVPGIQQTVESKNNSSEQGYWAWYRYFTSDPRSPYWYADLSFSDGSSQNIKSKPSGYPSDSSTFDRDGSGLPAYPGLTSITFGKQVQLEAARDQPFKLGGSYIQSSAVAPITIYATGTALDTSKLIDGPEGVPQGRTISSTIPSYSVTNGSDSDHYIINAEVDFNQPSYYYKQLNSPPDGAKVMVYYYAFTVDLAGTTYRYQPQLNVTFAPAPTTADIGNLTLTAADACFTTGTAETFHFSFRNYGSQDISTAIKAHVTVEGTPFQDYTYGSGLKAGQQATGSFTYTFSSTAVKSFTLIVDPLPVELNTTDNSKVFTFTAQSTCTSPELITADFTIQKTSIEFGDFNAISSNNISVSGGSGCTIKQVAYTVSQNGNSKVYSSSSAFSFNTGGLPPDPGWMTVGTVSVTLKVTSTCGGQATAGPKTFQVKTPASCTASNSPPVFQAGWFHAGDRTSWTPESMIVVNDYVWLRVAHKPAIMPGDKDTPYDPDGDPFFITWDFGGSSSSWVKQLKTDYGLWDHEPDGWTYNFKASVLGTHSLKVTATDKCGNQSQSIASMNVVLPNPVPIITLPPKVVEGRTFTPDIDGSRSYSPRNYAITSYDWHGTKQPIYPSAGTYTIQLDVTDSVGMKSIEPATATLNVLPDAPPVAQLNYNTVGIRGTAMDFTDTSNSPDNDPISEHIVALTCDKNNNGSYADDVSAAIAPGASGRFTYTPMQVGNCKVHIHIKEGLGLQKSDDKDFYFSVVNLQPTADYSATGTQPQPPDVVTDAPTGAVLLGTSWTSSSLTSVSKSKEYTLNTSDGSIETKGGMSFDPYKGLTGNNVTTSVFTESGSYCPNCGNSHYGVFGPFLFDQSTRLGKRVWYTGASFSNDWHRTLFYNEDRNSTFKMTTIEPYYLRGVNPLTNQVWTRADPYTTCSSYSSSYSWTDRLYRITDILNAAGADPNYEAYYPSYMAKASPYSTNTIMITGTWNSSYGCYLVTPPGPPPGYTPPSPVPDNTIPSNYNNTPLPSSYSKDLAGNTFEEYCTTIWTNTCNLVKYSPNKTQLWNINYQSQVPNKSYPPYVHVSVAGISSDNSKLILIGYNKGTTQEGSYYYKPLYAYIVDNATGGVLKLFDSSVSAVTRVLGRYTGDFYLGTYNDTVAYVHETTSGTQSTPFDQRVTTWNLMFYNLVTGVTTDAGIIKTLNMLLRYDSNCNCSSNYNTTTYRNALPVASVSADGKIMIANFYTNVLVYDMTTFAKIADIANPLFPSSAYGDGPTSTYETYGSSYSSSYFIANTIITEDGRFKVVYENDWHGSSDSSNSKTWNVITYSANTDPSGTPYTYGQLTGSGTITDGDVSAQIKFNWPTYSDESSAGVSLRIQDNRNMYRAELSMGKVQFVKIVNGVRTVLGQASTTQNAGTYYALKVHAMGNHFKVYVAGVPLVDVYDNSSPFSSGKYGTFAEVPYVAIKDFNALVYLNNDTAIGNIAIVNSTINYAVTYSDTENDPAISSVAKWTFTNLQPHKFLDAGDGASDPPGKNTYNGIVVTTPNPELTRVGYYKVDYQVPDDPAPAGYKYPSTTFAAFRRMSDPATHYITVHRRPIAVYSLTVQADGTLTWNDTSYDPDRWLSSTNYSTEATGINYAETRGITNRRYMYTSPSGATTYGQLTRPQETGAYTVRESVMDEYGAWSDWNEQTVNVTLTPPNQPPSTVLTFPNGTQSDPSYVNTLTPTIRWNQSDPDPGTTFAAFHVLVKDENGTTVIDSGIKPQGTTAASAQWALNGSLVVGRKYQVQVQVSDGNVWSAWSNVGWIVTNSPPSATMTFPGGSQASPTVIQTVRPTFQWQQTDADPGTVFAAFQLRIANESGAELLDTGTVTQNTSASEAVWTAITDLPSRQKLRVQVRVFDGFAWSEWSADTWFLINRRPDADFDWLPKPVWEGDTIRLSNLSSDPDADTLTSTWIVITPGGSTITYKSTNVSAMWMLAPGTYAVTLTVSDGLFSHSATKQIVVVPLGIDADVTYMSEWLDYHRRKGHRTDTSPKQFYSGEVFAVTAQSSPASVTRVRAWIDTLGRDGNPLQCSVILGASGVPYAFAGELFDEKMLSVTEGLPEGPLTIHFEIVYGNGVVKRQDVQVDIIGTVLESVGIHRVR